MNAPSSASPTFRMAAAEFVGTGLLVTTVVGSGIAATRLSPADTGLQLLENSIATGAALAVLILVLGPISRAHFNPVVSLVDAALTRGRGLPPHRTAAYLAAQILGAVAGAVLANAMFEVPTSIATTDRVGAGTVLGEVVATAGLVLVVLLVPRAHPAPVTALAVGGYIAAAYWFTSSTSFANPAVTIGRMFSDSFAGIAPASAVPFIAAQLVGAGLGALLVRLLAPAAASDASRVVVPTVH